MYAHHVPHTYFTLTPKQTNPPEPCKIPGDFHVSPTGFEPATFRVGAREESICAYVGRGNELNDADCFPVTSASGQTIPMPISTSSATMTTSAEMMKPWIMGRMPAFFILAKEVFRPMAASAQTIRNLLALLVALTT